MNKDSNFPDMFNEYSSILFHHGVRDDSWDKKITINGNYNKMNFKDSSSNIPTNRISGQFSGCSGGSRGKFGIGA